MSQKITNDEGVEIEVYTADEVKAQVDAGIKTKEDEFGKTKAEIEKERDDARTALNERTGEIKSFRKLNDDTVAKLGVAERTIYENQKFLSEEKERRETAEKTALDNQVTAAIRAKVGTDENLFKKVKDMYAIIGIEANTQEEIDRKTLAALGALNTTEPNLLASVNGFGGGSYTPPAPAGEQKNFGDTDAGKALAGELGLTLEAKK